MSKINVTKSSLPPYEEYINEIKSIWDNHWLTNMGEKHNSLEEKLKEYLQTDNVSLFSNGHMALELAIQALQLSGEVITTPYTFASTTHAIIRNHLTPVFCDIIKPSCTIDTGKIEALINEKTSAIIPVHVYGNICDVEAIQKIADKYKLKVLYDAAHVFGVKYKGIGIGCFGDMSMFSLHATKVFNTIEGGVVTFRNDKYLSSLYNLKNFGISDAEHITVVGANSKMNEFQAAMGLCNLKYLNEQIAKRKKVVDRYCEKLKGLRGIEILLDFSENIKHNYAYFPIFIDDDIFKKNRNEIADQLEKHDIIARKYFYPITTDFDCYKDIFDSSKTPIAKKISSGVLTLPLYPDLELSVVDKICDIIKNV